MKDQIEAARAAGVAVLNLPGSNARTMAEHTIMLILAVRRGLVHYATATRNGDWSARATYDRDEIAGGTLGIIGLGNIGQRVAVAATALGMDVVYADPNERAVPFGRLERDELLERADVISLHCQLDASTRHLIDAAAFKRMRAGTVLINTARGALVETGALRAALESGHLAGYGADVLDVEPPAVDDPLLALPHVVVTPHVGSLTATTYRDMCVRSVRNVVALLSGRDPEPGARFA